VAPVERVVLAALGESAALVAPEVSEVPVALVELVAPEESVVPAVLAESVVRVAPAEWVVLVVPVESVESEPLRGSEPSAASVLPEAWED
jgi:hypothetical protein